MSILDRLSIDTTPPRPQRVTIGYVKKELGKAFKQEMEWESDEETGELIFPISFHIIMHPDDYQTRRPFFERWGPIILARIYSIIRRKKRWLEFKHRMLEYFGKKYPDVKYTPTDARWCIQFAPAGMDENLRNGKIKPIVSYTIPFKVEYTQNAPKVVQDLNCTMMTRDSKTKKLREQSLDGIRILDEGIRLYPFDKSLQEDADKINKLIPTSKKELATLQWDNLRWSMYETYIEISGKEDTRNTAHILKLNSDKVRRTHVVIQYKDNGFQLAAWGPTMLNERYVELSKDTVNIKWQKLNSNSTIVLNNAIVIHFKANPDLI